MKSNEWFTVDKEGFKALQLGKPKYYIIRELIQNAIDEKITTCNISISNDKNKTTITVEDDGCGFRNINDAFTLFGKTYKQTNPELRGRFNLGEKQSFAICDAAIIETTSGTVTFDKSGRHVSKTKCKDLGTKVTVTLKMNKQEYQECIDFAKMIIIPFGITVILNGDILPSKTPFKSFTTSLRTEILFAEQFKPTIRKTKVDLYQFETAHLYEMGIPVCEIDCEYSIDINQRIPLGIDRDTVSQAYLQDVYAEVLNQTADKLNSDNISSSWVRIAMTDERMQENTVKTVINKRYGDNVVVANPSDRISIDDALSHGYRVVYGSEMSKDEWNNVKKYDVVPSSTDIFGHDLVSGELVIPNEKMQLIAELTKKIANRIGGFDVSVMFMKSKATNLAQYGDRNVTFNVSTLGMSWFNQINDKTLEIIIHELCHEYGHHTESAYHEAICKWGAELTMIALKEPEFFEGFI